MLPKGSHDLPGSQPPGSFSALLLPSSGSSPSGKARPLRISLPAHYDVSQTAVPRRKLARLAVLASFLSVIFFGTFVSLRSFSSSASRATDCDLPASFAQSAVEYEPPSREFSELADLVIVAGHAVYVGKDYAPSQLADERRWILDDFQRGNGQVETFLQHIRTGVELANGNPQALLMFAGGPTRLRAGMQSEGHSYWLLAQAMFPDSAVLAGRAFTEERSRDSYENLVFAIARFREITGGYPRSITVVGFEFKRNRFTNVHRAAIRWPESRFTYVGIDPAGTEQQTLSSGEAANSLNPFHEDMYGCHGVLREKKLRRNPFRYSSLGYVLTAREISGLLLYCPEDGVSLYPGQLPWSPSIEGQ